MARTAVTLLIFAATVIAIAWLPFHARSAAKDMTSTLLIQGSRIDVTLESGDLKVSHDQVLQWVKNAGEAVATYYGKYPVAHLTLQISPSSRNGVSHGMTWGSGGGLIKIHVGSDTPASELSNDWMLTHEMVHLSFPSVADEHHWIEEGIATYVEPIARIQAGQMTAVSMWSDLARDMAKGVPNPDDKGLDHTHSWASTYWGGALFCFLADIEIRKETDNRKGLQDALRGILNAGGDIRQDWKLEDAFSTGDRATGTNVLMNLYGKMKDQPMPVDLPDLWKQLGITPEGRTVRLDDNAPLAQIRIAITRPEPPAAGSPAATASPTAIFAGRTANPPRSTSIL
jgi:hypothetical protein